MVFISFIHSCFSDSDLFSSTDYSEGGICKSYFYFISFTSSAFNSVVLLFGFSIFIQRLSKEEIGGSGGGGQARKGGRKGKDHLIW